MRGNRGTGHAKPFGQKNGGLLFAPKLFGLAGVGRESMGGEAGGSGARGWRAGRWPRASGVVLRKLSFILQGLRSLW